MNIEKRMTRHLDELIPGFKSLKEDGRAKIFRLDFRRSLANGRSTGSFPKQRLVIESRISIYCYIKLSLQLGSEFLVSEMQKKKKNGGSPT